MSIGRFRGLSPKPVQLLYEQEFFNNLYKNNGGSHRLCPFCNEAMREHTAKRLRFDIERNICESCIHTQIIEPKLPHGMEQSCSYVAEAIAEWLFEDECGLGDKTEKS